MHRPTFNSSNHTCYTHNSNLTIVFEAENLDKRRQSKFSASKSLAETNLTSLITCTIYTAFCDLSKFSICVFHA